MRNTKQKELVFNIIEKSRNHLIAQQVFEESKKEIENISLGTVYRILNGLVEDSKIIRISTESGIDHFDRIADERHSHFICKRCGNITDIFNSKFTYNKNELNGYLINDIETTFTGICNECMKGKK